MLTSWCSWEGRVFSRHIINVAFSAVARVTARGARSAAAGLRNRHRHQVAVTMADIVELTN
jgi:hypothetical protein